MNIRILHMVGLYLLVTSCLLYAGEKGVKDYADKYYTKFDKWQGDGIGSLFANFNREVPTAMQPEVLAQMLDDAVSAKPQKSYLAANYIFKYVENVRPDITISQDFETNVYTLATDSNHFARRDAIQFVGNLGRAKDQNLVLSALNDSDEEVRGAAINAMAKQPGSETAYQKFIRDHQSDPKYATSIQYAKGALDEIHQGQKSNNK